ncbi:hypothetical protein FRC06_010080 [Ceratobasidium sp. 370]|nr:hypothetical protein FRC06_010080 [Ceratobasidium sp. 370]
MNTTAVAGEGDQYHNIPDYDHTKQTACKSARGKVPCKQLATEKACKSAKHLPKKYTLEEFEAQLAQRGFVVRPTSGPLALVHAARKAEQAAPRLSDPKFDLDLNLNVENDGFSDSDAPVNPTPLDNNSGSGENPPARTTIVVHWCEKLKGSPGRGTAGYNLWKKLGMPARNYRLILSSIKVLLMHQHRIDMTASITFQDEDILWHVLMKAAKQYPEFDIFAKQGRWPLRAFVHSILRTSSNMHQENSGQPQSKKKKGGKAAEDQLPAVDQSMRDITEPLCHDLARCDEVMELRRWRWRREAWSHG